MIVGDYKIHYSEEKNQYVFVRQSYPHVIFYIDYVDNNAEINKMVIMENCSPSSLAKALLEFESYFNEKIIKNTVLG